MSFNVRASLDRSSFAGGTGSRLPGVRAVIAAARRLIASTGRSAPTASAYPATDGEQKRREAADDEFVHQPVQRPVALVERRRKHECRRAVPERHGSRQDAPLAGYALDRAAPKLRAAAARRGQITPAEERADPPRGRRQDRTARAQELANRRASATAPDRARSRRRRPAPQTRRPVPADSGRRP